MGPQVKKLIGLKSQVRKAHYTVRDDLYLALLAAEQNAGLAVKENTVDPYTEEYSTCVLSSIACIEIENPKARKWFEDRGLI